MLVAQIKADMVAAMKARDSLRVECLRFAMSAFTNELVARKLKPTEILDDAGVLTVLKRLAKQRKEAADQFTTGGREDLASKERAELKIIESYLPTLMSREEIEKNARAIQARLGITDPKDMGKLMGAIMKELAGKADGNDVKAVAATLFN